MSNASAPVVRPFVVVVGVDKNDTESSGHALNQAARIAMRIPGSHLHFVYALPAGADADVTRDARGWLQRYLVAKAAELGGLPGQSVGIHVRSGEPGHEIAQLANDAAADMIIVGTQRHPHLKQLLMGSTAEHVMSTATCPVLVAGSRPPPKHSDVVVIEPPCPDCVRTRQATHGRTWWCPRHSEKHVHGHRYSYQTELPFAEHDSEVTATGV
jgi:nucleotide-binding universal stress UspA family protein